MQFEFDPNKNEKNKEKHGIDFIEAQKLWEDSRSIGFRAKSDTEQRFTIIGMIEDKFWVGFYTLRDGKIRIISVRRARKGEKTLYEG